MRLTFNQTFHIEDHPACAKDYIHIGNNIHTVDKPTLTSYKYCGHSPPEEIVSRGQTIWIAFRSGSQFTYAGFNLFYEVLPEGKYMILISFIRSLPWEPLQC